MKKSKIEKLKVGIIREEYVALTGDFRAAVLLNQFIYWSQRVADFDQFINEENIRLTLLNEKNMDLNHGWIYKSMDELLDENPNV